jgi:hypothetical protein
MTDRDIAESVVGSTPLQPAVGKWVDVNRYPDMRSVISDEILFIESLIPFETGAAYLGRIESWLGDVRVFPIFGMLGGHLLCVGTGEQNQGVMHYLDFDFGLFPLEPFEVFLSHLIERDVPGISPG